MRPLEGVRIIDMTTFVAAPAASRLLGEWGADCIKIESPGGDPARTQTALFNMPFDDDENLGYDVGNMNKRFMSIDLKNPEGMKILERLLEGADVLVTNFRAQALSRMGLDYESLKERFPRLIYAHCLGYGMAGPEKDTPGFDVTCYNGRGGVVGTTANRGSAPMVPASGFGDLQVSSCLASGICAALFNRSRTGKGDRVVVSLHHTAVYMLSIAVASAQYGNEFPKDRENVVCPTINFYNTKDGKWLAMCVAEYDKYYDRVMEAIRRPDLVGKSEYSTMAKVNELGTNKEVIKAIEGYVAQHNRDDIVSDFKARGLPCESCYEPLDIHKDEQAWANGILEELDCPSGPRNIPTSPVSFDSNADNKLRVTAAQGTHTEQIMAELGYSPAEIARHLSSGTIIGKKKLVK